MARSLEEGEILTEEMEDVWDLSVWRCLYGWNFGVWIRVSGVIGRWGEAARGVEVALFEGEGEDTGLGEGLLLRENTFWGDEVLLLTGEGE